jgi:formamidopyrimidine-DNA glycosylase
MGTNFRKRDDIMIEIPESYTISRQLNNTIKGKTILNVYANTSPHKFAWYFGDPSNYHGLLARKRIDCAKAYGGLNGVLQDILFNARIHPKRKIKTLSRSDFDNLYESIKSTLLDMAFKGGRDTEKDLFGFHGGYKTIMSKNTAGKPCPVCSTIIKKEAYLGGSVYYCENCQREN